MVVSRVASEKPIDDHGFAIASDAVEEQIGHARLTRVSQQVTQLRQEILGAGVTNPTRPTNPFDALVIGEPQGLLGRLVQMVGLHHRAPPGHQTVQYPPCRAAAACKRCRWPLRRAALVSRTAASSMALSRS